MCTHMCRMGMLCVFLAALLLLQFEAQSEMQFLSSKLACFHAAGGKQQATPDLSKRTDPRESEYIADISDPNQNPPTKPEAGRMTTGRMSDVGRGRLPRGPVCTRH